MTQASNTSNVMLDVWGEMAKRIAVAPRDCERRRRVAGERCRAVNRIRIGIGPKTGRYRCGDGIQLQNLAARIHLIEGDPKRARICPMRYGRNSKIIGQSRSDFGYRYVLIDHLHRSAGAAAAERQVRYPRPGLSIDRSFGVQAARDSVWCGFGP